MFYKILLFWKEFIIISIITIILGFFYYKYFSIVNKFLWALFKFLFKVFSCFSFLFFIVFWIFAFFFPKDLSNNFVSNGYRHLVSPKSFIFRTRILDENDTMPFIRDVESVEEIEEILRDTDLMEEMLRGLIQNKLPCVFSYNIETQKTDEEEEFYPNFMILNKKYEIMNKVGKNIKYFANILGINKSIWSKALINTIGMDSLQGPFYFIFNANISGGSLFAGEEVIRHSSLYKWDRDPEYLKFRLTIQIDCISVFFYKNQIIIEPTIMTFQGRLAFCIQDYLLSIENYKYELNSSNNVLK